MRLIDADTLLALCKSKGWTLASLKTIKDQPTIDAEPVKHGHWIKNGDRYCECSVCHHEGNISGQDNYCWFCGAKMDEVEDD